MTLVFLGGGRITNALLSGLRQAKYRGAIVVHDRNPYKLKQLRRAFKINVEPDLHRAVDQAGVLIIAVRPQNVPELLASIAPIRRPVAALSLAAGIPLARLRRLLGAPVRWARAMPSPTARNCRGFTALAMPARYSAAARNAIEKLFASVGEVIHLRDREMDAFTVTYSSTHGQYALQALSTAGRKIGLSRRVAVIAAAHALGESVISWREGGVPLKELLHEAATPGGIAACCMSAMDRGGYPKIVERSLRAGVNRARKFRR